MTSLSLLRMNPAFEPAPLSAPHAAALELAYGASTLEMMGLR